MLEFNNRGVGAKARSHSDISICFTKGDAINITFRNGAADKASKVNGMPRYRIEYAIEGTRLYFRGTSSSRGFTCYTNGKNTCKNYYCKIDKKYQTDELVDFVLQFEGDYELRYDSDINLYYIESGIKFHGKE